MDARGASSHWAVVKDAFARVHEAAPDARPLLLDALDADVRREVLSLLAALDEVPRALSDAPPAHGPGSVVGPYRLLEEIGRGGMGTVYRAVRADGEIDRPLALKMAGCRIFAPEAQRRFIQERQILATLDHPHIVRLLDGGVSEGQRYFVMELVEGTPITRAVREQRMSLRDRIVLFRQLSSAIHYAHQRLVLHRDLKPGNVLVTPDGRVKVLDFGIAQVVQAGTLTAETGTVMHPLSFACASPEQLRGEPLALTSDVYSLGTLLYEVLTGTSPQFREEASVDEALRRVLEQEPERPSRLNPDVPRDLDAITMKALAKAPADRYQSVSDLDADLGRWLEGRPVAAVPPRPWYVLTRFVRRNRALSATAAALVISLVAGGVAVTRQARIAERRFEDARQLIHTTIFDIQPRMEAIPATLELRKTLIEETMKYLEAVSAEAGDNVPLLQELSNAYVQLARVQGDVSTSSLGNAAAADERFQKAKALLDTALAREPANPTLLKDATLLHMRLATFENGQGRSDEALVTAMAGVAFADRNVAARPGEYDARELRAGAIFTQALNTPAESWEDRRAHFVRARDEYATLAAEDPAREPVRRNVGIVTRHLASMHYDRGQGVQAVAYATEATAVSEATLANRPDDIALKLEAATDAYLLGMALDQAGRAPAATARYERALALLEPVRSVDRSNTRIALVLGETRRNFAASRLGAGDLDAAGRHADAAVSLFESIATAGPLPQPLQWRFAAALATRADVDAAEGQSRVACEGYRRARDIFAAADRVSALTDMVKRDFERVRLRADACTAG
jgi:non-specific serine/threonine protein kinase/serine/threonine-protein kinase